MRDGHAQVKTQLDQQLIQDVGLGALFDQVILVGKERLFQSGRVWIPCANVRGVQLEYAKSSVSDKQRAIGFHFRRGEAQPLLGELSNVARSLDRVTVVQGRLLLFVVRV